jgi:RNA polymerase primary sigma factor
MVDYSLDTAMGDDSESNYIDVLEDPGAGPEEKYISQERDTKVREALARVRKRIGGLGWAILQERLTQDTPRTLEELGRRWGVSRERVRQVEVKMKTFLARYLSEFNQQETEVAADAA